MDSLSVCHLPVSSVIYNTLGLFPPAGQLFRGPFGLPNWTRIRALSKHRILLENELPTLLVSDFHSPAGLFHRPAPT
jgi:hypothetical protein